VQEARVLDVRRRGEAHERDARRAIGLLADVELRVRASVPLS
jgi:hypothetical protein